MGTREMESQDNGNVTKEMGRVAENPEARQRKNAKNQQEKQPTKEEAAVEVERANKQTEKERVNEKAKTKGRSRVKVEEQDQKAKNG